MALTYPYQMLMMMNFHYVNDTDKVSLDKLTDIAHSLISYC